MKESRIMTTSRRARAWTVTFALGASLVAAPALAAPPPPAAPPAPAPAPAAASAPPSTGDEGVQKAVARYQRGQELYTERNFPAALVEFRKAYELAPNYRVLYNIGQVCYQMQDYVCALRSLEQYLVDGSADLPEARKQAVNEEVKALKARIGYLDVHATPEGAELTVDDVPAGVLPLKAPLAVGTGRHRLTVTLAGHAPVTRTVDVAGQDTLKVELPLVALRGPEAATSTTTTQGPENRHAMTTWSWVGYGVGAALLAGGGVTGAMALGPASDVRSKLYTSEADAESDRSKAKNLALVSDILLATGIVTVAATTILTFVVPHGSRASTALGYLRTRYTF